KKKGRSNKNFFKRLACFSWFSYWINPRAYTIQGCICSTFSVGLKLKAYSNNLHGDFTINHFANSEHTPNRLKKGHAKVFIKSETDDLQWFEKYDDDTFVGHTTLTDENVHLEQNGVITGNRNLHQGQAEQSSERVYPLDLWFILSDYILPETIGKFSLLCRDSYAVTCTAAFFRRLWSCYKPKLHLKVPQSKRLICNAVEKSFERRKGFCPDVIRAMHNVLPQYSLTSSFSSENLHNLEGLQCLMQWHKLHNKQCIFNFKMKSPPKKISIHLRKMKDSEIWFNPEDNCSLLQVVCKNFMDLSKSQITGLTLTKTYVTISGDMTSQKIKLIFHDTRRRLKPLPMARYKEAAGNVIVLCSVLSFRVLHWWNPSYPFRNIMNSDLWTSFQATNKRYRICCCW
ncbi:transmembrane protein 183-like, partial [Clavelina lepadiformis]|uniref:transmembrane protein 183-like n=1 Tax=Clavelina lepadiformis TaxID=159417 RepID=UPI00404181B7